MGILLLWFGSTLSAQEFVKPNGEFNDARDRSLVEYQLSKFRSECVFIGSMEANVLKKIDEKITRAKGSISQAQRACYDAQLPRMRSLHFNYRKLCDRLNYDGIPQQAAGLITSFNSAFQLQDGISLLHVVLNDCLTNAFASNDLMVPTQSMDEGIGLSEKIRRKSTRLPFVSNRVEIR